MKLKLKYQLLSILCMGNLAASAQDVCVSAGKIIKEGDNLIINILIKTQNLDIKTLESISLEPVLQNGSLAQILPAIVYTGRQRYRLDRRAQTINPAELRPKVYHTYKGIGKRQTYSLDYRAEVPYQAWMGKASIVVNQYRYDCYTNRPQKTDAPVITLDLDKSYHITYESQPLKHNPDIVPRMIFFIVPEAEIVKDRTQVVSANIDFKRGSSSINAHWGQNQAELAKVDELLRSVTGELITLNRIKITGYASPDGAYDQNEQLAKKRSLAFRNYLIDRYSLRNSDILTDWVAEDWDGLVHLINGREMSYKEEVLKIIASTDIFNFREKKLMELGSGSPYKEMFADLFPLLRRIELKVEFTVGQIPDDHIKEIFKDRPWLLSLEEMYRIAPDYRTGGSECQIFYETAARHFPSDIAANNAAAAALLNGDVQSARYFLGKIRNDPRSFINQGVLCYIEEDMAQAEAWFRKAANAGIEAGSVNLELLTSNGK